MLLAGSSLLTLLDDIATLLDDISVMGKLAAKKTAGVLGDDLSLNAQQVSGVRANRELPVVWGVAKGSLINKVILVPLALIISAFIPWAITPLLMIGGAFLCFEGVEKVLHMLEARKHKEDPAQSQQRLEKLAAQDPLKFEKDKIKGAIRTDFILSAEIVAITLGIVAEAPLLNQVLVLSGIALVVTVGVYGLVGVIVKIDDLGYWLAEKSSALMQALGKGLLITGAVAGISALAIKNKIETKEAEKEAEKEYEEWERELEEQRAENEKRKSMICEYDEIMTEDIFETIVVNCRK